MEDSQTLTELRRLLALYDGIVVDALRSGPVGTTVVVRVANQASLARLVACAEAANVPTHVGTTTRGTTDAEWADPERLRYAFLLPGDPAPPDPPSVAQILGINMVWNLARRGVLDRGDANRLLMAWNGAEV